MKVPPFRTHLALAPHPSPSVLTPSLCFLGLCSFMPAPYQQPLKQEGPRCRDYLVLSILSPLTFLSLLSSFPSRAVIPDKIPGLHTQKDAAGTCLTRFPPEGGRPKNPSVLWVCKLLELLIRSSGHWKP